MNNHRIMVIDDEKIVCDMAKLSLSQEGYVVETFMNPEKALKEHAEDPRIILTEPGIGYRIAED